MTFGEDVLAKLRRAKTLADALRIAVAGAGSHDKLGQMLGTSRQTIIGWQGGKYPSKLYRDRMIAVGFPARVFATIDKTAIEKRLRVVEAEVASIRKEIE